MGWSSHGDLGHSLGLPLIIMLITAYIGRLPGSIKRLTWLLLGVYILHADVFIFMRDSAPAISALHPVMALIDFALGLTLVVKALSLVKQPLVDQVSATGLEASAAGLMLNKQPVMGKFNFPNLAMT